MTSFAVVFFLFNMLFCCSLFFISAPLKLFSFVETIKKFLLFYQTKIANLWIFLNNLNIALTQKVEWDIRGSKKDLRSLNKKSWYFLVANHQSAIDILVLQKVFLGKIPFLKFFIKKELFWTPILGQCWWLFDFPFLERGKKGEKRKGRDFKTIKKQAKLLKKSPTTIISFLEGTRLTRKKAGALTQSPYTNLLKPKAGGFALILEALEEKLNGNLLDVTLLYPDHKSSLLDLFLGKVKKVVVHVRLLKLPENLVGSYEKDSKSREKIYSYVNELWLEKDKILSELKEEFC